MCHPNYCPWHEHSFTPNPRSDAWLVTVTVKSLSLRCDWVSSVHVRPSMVYGQEWWLICSAVTGRYGTHLLSKFLSFPVRQMRIETAPYITWGFMVLNRMMCISYTENNASHTVKAYFYLLSEHVLLKIIYSGVPVALIDWHLKMSSLSSPNYFQKIPIFYISTYASLFRIMKCLQIFRL